MFVLIVAHVKLFAQFQLSKLNNKKRLNIKREKEKLQKSSAKFWGIVITVILLIAIVWAVASHLM